MHFKTLSSPFLKPKNNITKVMLHVLLALIPALIAYIWYFGWGILFNIIIASLSAIMFEALALKLQNKPIVPAISDLSAILTAVLLAFALPPLCAWWITVLGTAFAILIAKHLYGGLGYNIFNPAMAAYIVLLISFPKEMVVWLAPRGVDLGLETVNASQTLYYIFNGTFSNPNTFDAISSATPLDVLKTDLGGMQTMQEIKTHPIFGSMGAHIFNIYDPDHYAKATFHVFTGAAMLCAFFIATDPVSAATSIKGRIIYGCGIGLLIYIIRTWGGYPDAIAFAVVLMNMCVPLIDYYFKPTAYGHRKVKGNSNDA